MRRALGAQGRDVVLLVVWETLLLVMCGLTCGVAVGVAGSRLLRKLL